MAHYALIDGNNVVVQVIVGIDEDDTDNLPAEFDSWEEFYGDFHDLTCKRTSYNTRFGVHTDGGTAFRGHFAGQGMTYDSVNDRFIFDQPYASWTFNESSYKWEPPITQPDNTNTNKYVWNEETYQNDTADPKTEGWELDN
jgi:hypothetical protein